MLMNSVALPIVNPSQRKNDVRKIAILFIAACIPIAHEIAPASAQPVRDQGPCEQIAAACRNAGFAPGAASTGIGLQVDCIGPILQGTPQPRRARIALPRVDPQLVAACKAVNARRDEERVPTQDLPAAPRQVNPPTRPEPTPAFGSAQACSAADDSIPDGLAVVVPPGNEKDPSLDLQALNNPSISGVAVQIDWRDVEPAQGRPDWSKLDAIIGAAESAKKWVHLLVFPGFFSPGWAMEGAETETFAIPYGPGHGDVARLPMPWDRVYLGRWFAFLKQLSERYGKSPAFRLVAQRARRRSRPK
jgi:hypothetical protein